MTFAVCVITTIALIVYDIYIVIKRGSKETISWVLYTKSKQFPIIAFGMGVVMGHIFWVQQTCGG